MVRAVAAKCIAVSCAILAAGVADAQWMTQQLPLTPGWNAVYLHVQPEPRSLNTVFTNWPVDMVYHWQRPAVTVQYAVDPGNPFPRPGDWQNWYSAGSDAQYVSTFGDLLANEAYYVHVKTNASGFTLPLKGTPVVNSYSWPGSAYSLFGLPVATNAPRTFTDFFSLSSDIPTTYGMGSHIYNVSSAGREAVVYQPNVTTMVRGQAYWILCNNISTYGGPLTVSADGLSSGYMKFSDATTPRKLTICNVSTNTTRQVIVRQMDSEAAPTGTNVPYRVSLLYGVMNWDPNNLGIQYKPLPAVLTNSLGPGASLTLSIRPDPSAMTNNFVYQSILAISDLDSQGRTFVNHFIGVSFTTTPAATGGDPSGLWVGDVYVTGVNRARIGLATNWDTSVITPVNSPFRFRVIMEVDNKRVAKLLQQAFVGWLPTTTETIQGVDGSYLAGTNVILHTMSEATVFVAAHTNGKVNRISAVNFPFMSPVTLAGFFGDYSSAISGNFFMAYTNLVNPFVHIYSPEHDNLKYSNGQPAQRPAGEESYDITRTLSFQFSPTNSMGQTPPDWGISQWGGSYSESIEGLLTPATTNVTANTTNIFPAALIKAAGIFSIQKITGPSN